jgi:hypothetical protein
MTRAGVAGLLMAAGLVAAGCDNGPSAVQTRDRTDGPAAALTSASLEGRAEKAVGETGQSTEKAVVTANRRETASIKIARLYERNGAAFGARSAEDYAERMRTFLDHPPAGVDTVKRPNGDTLYYQASTNTFAVVARDGTPRTMFKPDDGPAYWAEQKARAPAFGTSRSGSGE